MRLAPRTLAFVMAVTGCAPSPSTLDAPPIASDSLGLVRSVTWPGGGRELTIRVQTEAGEPISGDLSSAFAISPLASTLPASALTTRVDRVALGPGFTAIVVVPTQEQAERNAQAAAIAAFVESRPSTERIGLYVWRESLEQVGNFTVSRPVLAKRIDHITTLAPAGSPAKADDVLSDAAKTVLEVGGKQPQIMRAVVVVGAASRNADASAVPIIFGLERASSLIDSFASTSHYRVALCGPGSATTIKLEVAEFPQSLAVELPATLPEHANAKCDVAVIAAGERDYPRTIELLFTAEQKQIYEERLAGPSKADFGLSVRLDPSQPSIEATAHLRGRGSLGCERRSYTLALEGPARHLIPDSRSDEYYLISMCPDDRYVNQYLANLLLRENQLFPLHFRYIEVRLDGLSRGVYLLIEKPREELVRDNARVSAVLRRRFAPPDEFYEIKFGEQGASAVAQYQALTPGNVEGSLELDLYLRFIAFMTALQNGDYIDEVWLTATESIGPVDSKGLWFEPMAWDNDDLFASCHYDGRYSFEDPKQLVYCAEAELDHALLSDPVIYDRYVDILEQVLTSSVDPERFAQAATNTESAILGFLDDPSITAAMTELVAANPEAVNPTVAKQEVKNKISALIELYTERRELLLGRIARYRGQR